MSDEVEQAEVKSALLLEAALADRRREAAKDNVPFIEGECEQCGDESKRLVRCDHPKDGVCWVCARCRDKFKLPVRRTP
jgi:hypothetical protein